MSRSSRAEIIISLFIIAACIAVIVESLKLAPGSFEPLGSGPVPQATAGLIVLLCGLVIAAAWRREHVAETPLPEQPVSALFLLLLTLVYVSVLHVKAVDFGVLTAAFLLVAIWGLERFRFAALLPAAAVAVVVGFGCLYIFTRIFVVDLPTWF